LGREWRRNVGKGGGGLCGLGGLGVLRGLQVAAVTREGGGVDPSVLDKRSKHYVIKNTRLGSKTREILQPPGKSAQVQLRGMVGAAFRVTPGKTNEGKENW